MAPKNGLTTNMRLLWGMGA